LFGLFQPVSQRIHLPVLRKQDPIGFDRFIQMIIHQLWFDVVSAAETECAAGIK